MTADVAQTESLGTLRVDLEIRIAAPRQRVWEALVDEIHLWWPRDFYATSGEGFTLEAWPGGRIFEGSGKEGAAGGLWGKVLSLEPPKAMTWVGHIWPPFGGPATSFIGLRLEDVDGGTLLEVTDSVFGKVGGVATLEEGWRLIFDAGLKVHVEKDGS